jgi:hypothetical protein
MLLFLFGIDIPSLLYAADEVPGPGQYDVRAAYDASNSPTYPHLLSTVYCLLSANVVCCMLSAACYLLSVCCLLSVVCCLLSIVCCLLSAVCCLLSNVFCLEIVSGVITRDVPTSFLRVAARWIDFTTRTNTRANTYTQICKRTHTHIQTHTHTHTQDTSVLFWHFESPPEHE